MKRLMLALVVCTMFVSTLDAMQGYRELDYLGCPSSTVNSVLYHSIRDSSLFQNPVQTWQEQHPPYLNQDEQNIVGSCLLVATLRNFCFRYKDDPRMHYRWFTLLNRILNEQFRGRMSYRVACATAPLQTNFTRSLLEHDCPYSPICAFRSFCCYEAFDNVYGRKNTLKLILPPGCTLCPQTESQGETEAPIFLAQIKNGLLPRAETVKNHLYTFMQLKQMTPFTPSHTAQQRRIVRSPRPTPGLGKHVWFQ